MRPAVSQIWDWLAEVPDPEIPVISLTDLGIIREVDWQDDTLVVTVCRPGSTIGGAALCAAPRPRSV